MINVAAAETAIATPLSGCVVMGDGARIHGQRHAARIGRWCGGIDPPIQRSSVIADGLDEDTISLSLVTSLGVRNAGRGRQGQRRLADMEGRWKVRSSATRGMRAL
jgi:hypothetical protein